MLFLALVALLGIAPVASAQAQGTSSDIAAVMDRSPDLAGATLSVQATEMGSQFVLDNPTPTEITVMSTAGDPLFRIGPGGVLANFRSPDWYRSKAVAEEVQIPPRAADRGTPVWVKVSLDPSWGWFDPRLRDATLTDDQKASMDPLDPFGAWSVPVTVGDRPGTADGHFEYRPPMGSFVPTLSETQPADGVSLTALPGNPTPGIGVNNQGAGEIVVLGEAGEPFLKVTQQGAEANEQSPTWLAQQGGAEAAGPKGDPAAPPQWRSLGQSPQVSFTVPWADSDLSPADLYAMSGSQDVQNWTISMIVDGQRFDVPGVTTFNPADRGGISIWWWIGGAVVLLAVVIVGTRWILRRRRTSSGSGGNDAGTSVPRGSHRAKADVTS
ncbi:hypothetical protein [Pseudonocardia endophytica]|uniref:hypothetical protein n=1 Tax=Pseudonocardia endophytica TaxID=401976 RepID=UPI0010482819|nr:hypothetical protein [Pseudonocardia endophytica]